MDIDIRVNGRAAVLVLSGRLFLNEGLRLREKIDVLLREGCREFVIDLSAVSYVDSGGLGELVAIYARVRREGTVRFTGLSERIAHFMSIGGSVEAEPWLAPDPFDPKLRNFSWAMGLGLGLAILVIIGMIMALR